MTDSSSDTKVQRISPSQLDLYWRCKRRWAFTHRAKQREPFTGAAQAGTETHKILEDQGPWDKVWVAPDTGKEYPVGEMAALLQSQTPDGVVAREKRWEVELDGLPFVGVTDFYSEEIVGDYKTTSSKRNAKFAGAKDPSKDLLIDPQRLFYTALVPSARKTLWLYGTWDTMLVTPREVEIDRAADKERLKLRVIQPASEMLDVPYDVDPLSMKPNVNECSKFPPHGCPHKSKCFPPGKFLPAVTNSKESDVAMSSLIEKLRAKAAAEGQPVVPPQPAPVASEPEVVQLAQQPAAVANMLATAMPAFEAASGDNPAARSEPAPAQAAEEPKKRRGRQRKVEQEAPASEPVSETQAPMSSPALVDEPGQCIIGTLYIDCLPLTAPFTPAFQIIAEAAEIVQNDMHVPHFGLVDFAKGGPALAAQLRANLSGRHIQALYLETRSAEGKAVMNTLISVSANVVRGVF